MIIYDCLNDIPVTSTPEILTSASFADGSYMIRFAAPRLLKSSLQYSALLSVGYGLDYSELGSICDACVLMKSFTSADVALGFDSRNSATTPATTGDAADVPLK